MVQNRIVAVDALRGFALFGILYSHMILWYTAGPLPQRIYTDMDIASGIVMGLYGLLFLGKFFSFFSFLFGLSFYLQMKSFEKRQESFLLRYGWRLVILGVIGLIHHALWRGDILSIYVPLGFILIVARKLSDKAIIVLGLLLMLNIPTKIYEVATIFWQNGLPQNSMADIQKEGETYFNVVQNGSFRDMVISNWKALSFKFEFQVTTGRLIITLGFFLLGMYVGIKGWFENLDSLRPFVKSAGKKISWVILSAIGVALMMVAVSLAIGFKFQENDWSKWFLGLLYDIFSAALTLFYVSGLTLMMYRASWQKILYPLSAIGKMALTSYLKQTAFGLILFYHFGFALFMKTTPAINALIAIGFFLFQVMISRWWLKRFSYGPVEWMWRSLTFFRLQPIVRKNEQLHSQQGRPLQAGIQE